MAMMMKKMRDDDGGAIELLPPVILQDILTMGRLEAADLARLDVCSSVFRNVPCGGFASVTEAAAHHYCQSNELFARLAASAQAELVARCEGKWKLVLHFLECLESSSGRVSSSGRKTGGGTTNVLMAGGMFHTLMVNGKGELYACGKGGAVLGQGLGSNTTLETPTLISLPPFATRIVQISASFEHAAFVTECGQVYTFGDNAHGCCGIGIRAAELKTILKPTLVRQLRNLPCRQVTTGKSFTMAITWRGEVFTWGCNMHGQLGHGNTRDKCRPRQIDGLFGESDPAVQVSGGERHSLAVTQSGKLFSWGYGFNFALGHDDIPVLNKLYPKRVEHGGFRDLFIVSAVAGDNHSVAIDSSGRVYRWGNEDYFTADSVSTARIDQRREADKNKHVPVLVLSLKLHRAIQVVARGSTFVLLDNGTVSCLSGVCPLELWQGRSYAIVGAGAHSISCGLEHAVVVTKRGTMLGLGYNDSKQLGVVWGRCSAPFKPSLAIVDRLTEVFTELHLSDKTVASMSHSCAIPQPDHASYEIERRRRFGRRCLTFYHRL